MKRKKAIQLRPRLLVRGCSELADRLGVTRAHVSMIMHGTRKPGRKLAAKLKEMGVKWPLKDFAGKAVAE